MTAKIKLPPLPYSQMAGNDFTSKEMIIYATEAIKAYQQQCGGEPVELDRYDAGLLGGQDGMPAYVWHDIIRAELDRAYDFYMDQLDRATPQPAAPAQDPTASEAVYAFAAWLTTRKHAVTLGSAQDAAIVAELVSLFVASQGWESPRDDYIDHLRAYPSEAPQPAAPSCDMGEHSCANPTQCWEPCGELGKSDEHANVVTSHEFDKWLENPYTKVLEMSIKEDYVPQPAAPTQEPSDALMDALRNQRQIDSDGSEVGVSRQALDEAIALLARYGNHHVEQTSAAAPKFGEEE